MAVEANVRKRKHSQQNEEDAVPKKIKKKMKVPKKQKQKEKTTEKDENEETINNLDDVFEATTTSENAEAQDSGFEEKPMKFPNDFKMLNFRTKLRGTNFITELRHFLYLMERKTRIVAKYIEKRGKPLELAEALERVNKTNLLHISYICEALQAVVMEIVSNQPAHMESATSACRYFLKVHSNSIEQLLESAQVKHRRVALKMLTAIVCVDPQVGRQILASFNILSDVRKINQYLSHSKFEQHEQETVRKCYIHFVLSFLVDGNSLLAQNIIDRSSLVQALVFGLLYDDHTTVCLVLKTLKKYVLENTNISKTKKVHVFDLMCCKQLVRLYDWLGPNVFAEKFSRKNDTASGKGDKYTSKEKFDALTSPEEKETVSATVHEFLLTLLGSRKYGIAFDATTNLRQKHNAIQGKIIGFIQNPWCCARKNELIIKILTACPDLARHSVRHFSNVTTPSSKSDSEWIAAQNFLRDIIYTLHPDLLCNALKQITLTDFTFWIKDICLPLETLVLLKQSNSLRHANPECRLATHSLLLAMFTQYVNFMNAAMQREQAKGSSSTLRRIRIDLFNHIITHFPPIDSIMNSLSLTITNYSSGDLVLRQMHVTLDLILIICKHNRSFVNKTAVILDYLRLIRPFYTGQQEEIVDDEDSQQKDIKFESQLANHGDIKLELKAIKVILLLHRNALKPNEQFFSDVLNSFIKGYVHGSNAVQRDCGILLREIFQNTGIFDTSALEIDIWLEALRFFDPVTVKTVTQVFIVALSVTQAEVDLPVDVDTEANEENLNRLFENIEKGYSLQTYVEAFAMSKLLPLILKGVEIVEPLDKYLELVCLLLFHYHPAPAYVLKLCETKLEAPSNYMNNWLSPEKSKNLILPKICKQIPHLGELHNALLNGYINTNFEAVFGTSDENLSFEIEVEQKKYRLLQVLKNERLLMIYIQQVIFVVTQLLEKQQLVHTQAELAAEYVIKFLAVLYEMDQEREDDISYTDDGVRVAKHTSLSMILTYIYDVRLNCIGSAQLCNAESEQILYFLHFLSLITEYCSNFTDFSNYVKNFRLKIVKAVEISLEAVELTKHQSNNEFIKIVEAFQLDVDNCMEILELLCKNLKYNDFFTPIGDSFQRTFYYELLICILRRLTTLQQAVQAGSEVKSLAKYYANFVRKLNGELNLEDFEEVFYSFLCIVHQYIPDLDSKLFTCMFAERKISKSTVKLACLLLERNDKLNEAFLNLLPAHIAKRELIYPLLEIVFTKNISIDTALLATVYQEYRNGFMKTIEKPQKAGAIYKEHADCSIALVTSCMPVTECMDFCKKRFQFNDASELYQIRLIHAIYEKAWNSLEKEATAERAKIFVNFLNLQVQLMSADLKRQLLIMNKLELFAYQIFSWCAKIGELSTTEELDFEIITKSQHWLNFCKTCLKIGMQTGETVENTDSHHSMLLKLMAFLCDKLYADCEYTESSETIEPNEPAQLFEMIGTHSKYYDIVLSTKPTQVKVAILRLLFTLAKKSPTSALPHLEIPVILGAYHAKLSEADRYALALLQLYEKHDPQGLQQYRPFIWGESAISFYALHVSDLDERTRLTQQETTINLVMSLIDYPSCEYTIDHFPIWRKLNSMQQLPTVEFFDPDKQILYGLGANNLERHIELNWSSSKSNVITLPASIDLRLCPKGDDVFLECYDPAFFIPLMSNCLAPGSYIHAARPVQNGSLAMCFGALSSQDKEMRLAAGVVQLRYRTHFEQSKFYERPLWIQAYENIQAGLAELSENWKQKHKKHAKDYKPIPRVPYIPTLFIAKTFNITNDPTDLLYKQLTMYLRLKNTFNFQCIPEFNIFFHSPEVEHHTFRQFIIDIIRKGVKSSSDLFLLVSTNTFKVLLGFYGGAMSTLETNLLILSALSTCAKIPASAKIMIENVGILPWLETIIRTLEFYHFNVIEGIISILNNLWYAITATRGDFYNYNYINLEMYNLIMSLVPLLSSRISVIRFAQLLNIMHKSAATIKANINAATPYATISEAQLGQLIGCAEKHFGSNIQYLKNLKTLGGAGAGSHKAYCADIQAQSVNEAAVLALSSLRAYIIDWWQNQESNLKTASASSELSVVAN